MEAHERGAIKRLHRGLAAKTRSWAAIGVVCAIDERGERTRRQTIRLRGFRGDGRELLVAQTLDLAFGEVRAKNDVGEEIE